MKNKLWLPSVAIVWLIMLVSNTTCFGQDGVSKLLESSPEDATKMIQAYLSPLFKGFGTGINAGWNNTASIKKFGRFELRLSMSGALVPTKDKSFDITKIGLSSNIRPTDPNSVNTPTVAGDKNTPLPQMDVQKLNQGQMDLFI